MTPEQLQQIRTDKFRLSRPKLAALLGYSGEAIRKIEKGNTTGVPKWMPYALAWLLLHGDKDPFA